MFQFNIHNTHIIVLQRLHLLLFAHQAKRPALYRVLIKLIPSLEFQDSNNTVLIIVFTTEY